MTLAVVLAFVVLATLAVLALLASRWPLWLRALMVIGVTGFYFYADEAVHNTCFTCHEAVKARDFVFTRYAP